MAFIFFNKELILHIQSQRCASIKQLLSYKVGLSTSEMYLEQNGRRLECSDTVSGVTYCRLCLLGGKGGFGSMLRAIGAQIEKTTNREACRDLSGRRLRDINEEKRLKTALEKLGDLEQDAQERKKRKIEKLLAVPRHDFKDSDYEEARAKLTEKVNNAFEEGLKNCTDKPGCSGKSLKRKNIGNSSMNAKKKKTSLWIDDDLLDSEESSESADESNSETLNLVKSSQQNST